MSQRIGQVRLSGQPVGVIEEHGSKLSFKCLMEWLNDENAVPISLTLPLRTEPYETEGLHPFFENLLPEGWLLDVSSKKLKTNLAVPQCPIQEPILNAFVRSRIVLKVSF